MTSRSERRLEHPDEFEFACGPDFEVEMFSDTELDETPTGYYREDARHSVERRAERAWLREQLADWDDWDEYLDVH